MTPTLEHHLPSRRPGSFGRSAPGRVAEWLTTTWFRLNVTLTWLLLVGLAIWQPGHTLEERLTMIATSPLMAPFMYFVMSMTFFVLRFIPGPGVIAGLMYLLHLWLFCRLVVERAPHIEMPAWIPMRGR